MSRLAPLLLMEDPLSAPDARRRYETLVVRALQHAERLTQGDQAFEVAHDVAIEMLRRPEEAVSGPLLYIAVAYRLRTMWRATERRTASEREYSELRGGATPAWARPDAGLETEELRERIEDVLAQMPAGMREAFLLVREDELSYKDAAARLGVSVGTVHTQISRANALLRECVKQYHADRPRGGPFRTGDQP